MPQPPEKSARILVLVDDDPHFLRALAANVELGGFSPIAFTDPRAALDHLVSGPAPDACVFDWNMPGLDGLSLLTALRTAGRSMPVLFLTALREPVYEELALDHGAVDFVEKSRSPAILLKRLEIAIGARNQAAAETPATLEVGDLALKVEIKRALWRNQEVKLSLGEFHLVWRLVRAPGQDVSYRELYDEIRGAGFVAGHGEEGYRDNVRAMIKRIRGKFLSVDPNFEQLENYAGFGYRWKPAS